jgi:hypothetical protein
MKIKEIHITSKVKKTQNLISRDSTKVTRSRMKQEKAKYKIQILGDNHARGLANELKYKLTRDYEIQGVIKPGSTLVNLVNTTPSDPKTLSKSDVCIVWYGSNDVGRNEANMGICALKHFISCNKQFKRTYTEHSSKARSHSKFLC